MFLVMTKRIKLLFDANHPMLESNIENLEKFKSELYNRGIGVIENDCEIVFDSENENEISALMDEILLNNNL